MEDSDQRIRLTQDMERPGDQEAVRKLGRLEARWGWE